MSDECVQDIDFEVSEVLDILSHFIPRLHSILRLGTDGIGKHLDEVLDRIPRLADHLNQHPDRPQPGLAKTLFETSAIFWDLHGLMNGTSAFNSVNLDRTRTMLKIVGKRALRSALLVASYRPLLVIENILEMSLLDAAAMESNIIAAARYEVHGEKLLTRVESHITRHREDLERASFFSDPDRIVTHFQTAAARVHQFVHCLEDGGLADEYPRMIATIKSAIGDLRQAKDWTYAGLPWRRTNTPWRNPIHSVLTLQMPKL